MTSGQDERSRGSNFQSQNQGVQAYPPPTPETPPREGTVEYMHYWLSERRSISASFEYFLDRYVHIEDKSTGTAIKLTLWPAQRGQICHLIGSRIIEIIKAHQLGFTWIFVAAYALWRCITRPLFQVIVNSFNEDVGLEIIKRVDFIRQRLPEMLYPPISKSVTDMTEFDHRDREGNKLPSLIQVIPATEKGGQSKTPNLSIFDESCQNRYFERAYNATYPGIQQAGGQIIIISNSIKNTPGWPFTRSLYSGSMAGTNDVKRIFLPWWAHPGRSRVIVKGEDGAPMLDGRGRPMTEFKLNTLRAGGKEGGQMTEEDFSQRYPETEAEAISVLGGSYFGSVLGRHNKTHKGILGNLGTHRKTKQPVWVVDPRGIMTVWRYPYYLVKRNDEWWTDRYCIGADISEGIGGTYSVGYVKDRRFDELVCKVRSNRIDAYRFADLLFLISCWYRNARDWTEQGVTFESAPICAERTGAGQTTVGRLKDLGANQYVRVTEGSMGSGMTKEFGWHESNQAKHDMSEDLRTWLRIMKGTIYDAVLVDELGTWIEHEGTTRLGPEGDKYGDCVVAAGMTEQMSLQVGNRPRTLVAPITGWRKELRQEGKGESAWAM